MKPAVILIAILVASAATATAATEKKKTYRCNGSEEQCRHMPVPPVPPAPPALPAPPAPPAPPEPPEVPAAAHAACDGKTPGTRITYTPSKNETITGTCHRTAEGMRLELRSWTVEN